MGIACTEEAVDTLVGLWHDGAGLGLELHEFLGWTWREYARWVERSVLPNPVRVQPWTNVSGYGPAWWRYHCRICAENGVPADSPAEAGDLARAHLAAEHRR